MDVDSISIPVHCGHHQVALRWNPSAIAKDPILLSSELCSQAKAFEFIVNVHEDGWAHRRTKDQGNAILIGDILTFRVHDKSSSHHKHGMSVYRYQE